MFVYTFSAALQDAKTDADVARAQSDLSHSLAGLGYAAKISQVDVGRGASADAFKLMLEWLPALSPIALFFLGSQIEKNLDAWVSLSKRLGKLLRDLKSLGLDPIVTFEAACAVALEEMVAKEWCDGDVKIEKIVISNRYVLSHIAFDSPAELADWLQADRQEDFDPLSIEAVYTFFGRTDDALFVITVDGQGQVLVSQSLI